MPGIGNQSFNPHNSILNTVNKGNKELKLVQDKLNNITLQKSEKSTKDMDKGGTKVPTCSKQNMVEEEESGSIEVDEEEEQRNFNHHMTQQALNSSRAWRIKEESR